MLLDVLARRVAALGDALAVVGVERAALFDQLALHGQIQHLALAGDALAVEHVHLTALERRGDLVFDDLDLHAVADDLGAVLDGFALADVDAHVRGGSIKSVKRPAPLSTLFFFNAAAAEPEATNLQLR